MTTSDVLSLPEGSSLSTGNQVTTHVPGPGAFELPLESILGGTSPGEVTANPKIMIVDDESVNIKVVQKYLKSEGYKTFVTTTKATEALELVHSEHPDVLLLDIMMPHVNGLQILEKIRADQRVLDLPVVILTAASDKETKLNALRLGATDFLAKPVDLAELVTCVRNALVVKAHHDHLKRYAWELELEVSLRTSELTKAQLELIHCLARAAEYRDNETGHHVIRVGRYAGIVARQLRLDKEFVRLIEHAAALHDIGKIGIPDSILLKPAKLDPEEFEFIQRHCGFGKRIVERMPDDEWNTVRSHTDAGAKILGDGKSPILRMVATISLTHHEKWDGSGYPLGLEGEDIPMEGRITAVADVFDALASKRPYKPAFPIEKCFTIMKENRGSHFDPTVLDAFFACKADIVETQIKYADVV